MGNSNLLFESIFKRKLSADDTREFLIKITNDHPYFSTAHFFLLLKTGKGTAGYREQAGKTSALFNNPYWLQFQLREKQQTVDEIRDNDFGGDKKFVPAGSPESHLAEPVEISETFAVNEAGNVNPGGSEIIEGDEQASPKEVPVTEGETEPLNFKLNIDTSGTTEDNITFEPLHTSDYFASLGIKLSNEIKPNDKLGKQLKSFTEWLKTMKKIHTDQLQPLSSEANISIQKLAEQSNKEDAVVTEAMADVLLQQGKAEKAIEVYEKLSLLNPSKSTYFAAKIDQLKEN